VLFVLSKLSFINFLVQVSVTGTRQ